MTGFTADLASQDRPAELGELGRRLRALGPSRELDARVANTIEDFRTAHDTARGRRWTRARRAWATGPAIAAGLAAIATAGLVLWAAQVRYGIEPGREVAALDDATSLPERGAPALDHAAPAPGQSLVLAQPPAEFAVDPANAFVVAPSGPYSLWPTEAAVFRVRTRLDATAPVLGRNAALADERQFWVDVRVANDGSMRIVRIVPVDNGEVERAESN